MCVYSTTHMLHVIEYNVWFRFIVTDKQEDYMYM